MTLTILCIEVENWLNSVTGLWQLLKQERTGLSHNVLQDWATCNNSSGPVYKRGPFGLRELAELKAHSLSGL